MILRSQIQDTKELYGDGGDVWFLLHLCRYWRPSLGSEPLGVEQKSRFVHRRGDGWSAKRTRWAIETTTVMACYGHKNEL